jgi:hypothetical protein
MIILIFQSKIQFLLRFITRWPAAVALLSGKSLGLNPTRHCLVPGENGKEKSFITCYIEAPIPGMIWNVLLTLLGFQ